MKRRVLFLASGKLLTKSKQQKAKVFIFEIGHQVEQGTTEEEILLIKIIGNKEHENL